MRIVEGGDESTMSKILLTLLKHANNMVLTFQLECLLKVFDSLQEFEGPNEYRAWKRCLEHRERYPSAQINSTFL